MTNDNEDHTFSGIMFSVECSDKAIESLLIRSLWVRGDLGPLTVWAATGPWQPIREEPSAWTQCYEAVHAPSYFSLAELRLDAPVVLRAGEVASLYVHSALRSDTAIVYDNERHSPARQSNEYLRVLSGCAHLAPRPFAGHHPWGAWRTRRQFVGRISFGVKHKLWQPERSVHALFPRGFQAMVVALLSARQHESSPLAALPEELLHYIIHFCKCDWAPTPPPPRSTSSSIAAAARTPITTAKKAPVFFLKVGASALRSLRGVFGATPEPQR